jgi:single-strand DNA-binding protein
MANSVNKIIILGRLGHDPEVRSTGTGKTVTSINIATSESFGTGTEKKETTTWHKVILWERLGDLAGNYLKKGSQVYIEGKITHRKYQAKDGTEKVATEVIASNMVFIGNKNEGVAPTNEQKQNEQSDETQKFGPGMNVGDDGILF